MEDLILEDGNIKKTPFYELFDYNGYGINFEKSQELSPDYEIMGE
jgi:hypothetical protein